MFKNPFSFTGRIRRTEYGLSIIIYLIGAGVISVGAETGGAAMALLLLLIPLLWFLYAQGAKRCHDRGNTGWFQLIPFYGLWMLFAEGDDEDNRFGRNPKEQQAFELDAEGV